MKGIDSHQHFWRYDPAEYPWIQSDWPLRRDFLPSDLFPLLSAAGLEGCVAVQARQTLEESRWLLKLAREYAFIRGVVGWVDLRSPRVEEQLQLLSDLDANQGHFVGVRHVVQDEPDDRFLLLPEFLQGIGTLQKFNLAYDLLIFPNQLPAAVELTRRLPEQRFVLDHIAKPSIKEGALEPWRSQIRELARSRNVFCKLSGMVTEARWKNWRKEDFRPFLDSVWESFGEDRLMFGSDWPVCLLGAEYLQTFEIVHEYLEQFSSVIREKVLGLNAAKFYKLEP